MLYQNNNDSIGICQWRQLTIGYVIFRRIDISSDENTYKGVGEQVIKGTFINLKDASGKTKYVADTWGDTSKTKLQIAEMNTLMII